MPGTGSLRGVVPGTGSLRGVVRQVTRPSMGGERGTHILLEVMKGGAVKDAEVCLSACPKMHPRVPAGCAVGAARHSGAAYDALAVAVVAAAGSGTAAGETSAPKQAPLLACKDKTTPPTASGKKLHGKTKMVRI